jgi:hypothetical protein
MALGVLSLCADKKSRMPGASSPPQGSGAAVRPIVGPSRHRNEVDAGLATSLIQAPCQIGNKTDMFFKSAVYGDMPNS